MSCFCNCKLFSQAEDRGNIKFPTKGRHPNARMDEVNADVLRKVIFITVVVGALCKRYKWWYITAWLLHIIFGQQSKNIRQLIRVCNVTYVVYVNDLFYWYLWFTQVVGWFPTTMVSSLSLASINQSCLWETQTKVLLWMASRHLLILSWCFKFLNIYLSMIFDWFMLNSMMLISISDNIDCIIHLKY